MSENQATNSFVSIFKWMGTDNVSKQIWSGHDWIVLLGFIKLRHCVFHVYFNITIWYKNMIACKCRWLSVFPRQDIFFILHHYPCDCLLMFFVRNSASLYSLSFVCKNCLRCLVKCPPEINSPKQNLASTSRCKTYVPYTNKALHSYVNSSEYGWFSYWSFNLSTLCEFLTIWSNSSSSAIHSCHQSMLIFFISLSPGRTWLLITQEGYKNDLAIISIDSPNQ